METGQRKDSKTGQLIPAHFIQEVNAEHKGSNVMTALWGPAISKNPYLSFKFSGANAGDTLKISWVDNKGNFYAFVENFQVRTRRRSRRARRPRRAGTREICWLSGLAQNRSSAPLMVSYLP